MWVNGKVVVGIFGDHVETHPTDNAGRDAGGFWLIMNNMAGGRFTLLSDFTRLRYLLAKF